MMLRSGMGGGSRTLYGWIWSVIGTSGRRGGKAKRDSY